MSEEPAESSEASETLMEQGLEQLRDGFFDDAAETFSACLTLQPYDAKALRGRGLAYLQLKKWSLAAADFRVVTELNPDDPENWVDLAVSLGMDNQVYPAIEMFETVLAKYPKHVRGHLQLGLLYFRLAAIAKGREQMQAALVSRPNLEERRMIERVLREQDQLDQKRYYRPDFEALNKQQRGFSLSRITETIRRWFGKKPEHPES